MDNLSMCGSGYVGTIYNTNSSRSNSLMNKMKPYLYMYNVLMYRLEKSIAKYKGMAENQISTFNLKFYIFRPAYIYPVEPLIEPKIFGEI